MDKQVRIYVCDYDGKQYREYLETRVNTHVVKVEKTGTTYPTFKAMSDGTLAKNRAIVQEMLVRSGVRYDSVRLADGTVEMRRK